MMFPSASPFAPPAVRVAESVNAPQLRYSIQEMELDLIADLLKARTGLRFDGARRRYLTSRLSEVAAALGYTSVAEFLDVLRSEDSSSDKFQRLVDAVVTEESSFFRYPQHFEALRHFILPAIASNRAFGSGDRTLRILSAGCSRGQEPYSIAMTCHDEDETLQGLDVSIYALDISAANLAYAREAVYTDLDLRDLSPVLADRYFEPCPGPNGRGTRHRVRNGIKRLVRFQQHNLKEELTGPLFDIIFCRNVTIYFDAEDTRAVAANLYSRLVPGGYLFLGHAESYYGILPGLTIVQFGEALVNRKPVR